MLSELAVWTLPFNISPVPWDSSEAQALQWALPHLSCHALGGEGHFPNENIYNKKQLNKKPGLTSPLQEG